MQSLQVPPLPDPTIPLTQPIRDAYEDLYNRYENAIEETTEPGLLAALLASQSSVDDVLTMDNMYRLKEGTVSLKAVLEQIRTTNGELKVLQAQIQAVASNIATAHKLIAAMQKVLTLVPVG